MAFANPKEGILTWVCGLVHLTTGKGDEQAVYDFTDSMLAPEAGKFEIENFGYGHANRKAFDLVSKERLEELGLSSPAGMFARSIFFREMKPEVQESYVNLLEEVKAGFWACVTFLPDPSGALGSLPPGGVCLSRAGVSGDTDKPLTVETIERTSLTSGVSSSWTGSHDDNASAPRWTTPNVPVGSLLSGLSSAGRGFGSLIRHHFPGC